MFAFSISESGSKVEVYKAGSADQAWKVEGSRIRHASQANCVVGVCGNEAKQMSIVRACVETSDKTLDWIVEYV